MPARVLMQDFTGVPAIVDLAAMRDAIKTLGGDPERVNPLVPAELVIDHSVQVDEFGTAGAYEANSLLEFQRNRERYAFLKWGQTAFRNFSAVPPGMGICHQVNLEYLARVVFTTESRRRVACLSRHAGRHRLAHHDDQRPGRAGLGRRRHRGRGGHARPGRFHAGSAGGRLQADRQAARGRDRNRPGADRDAGAAQARRRRQIRGVLRARALPSCRWPIAPPSATWRRSMARPAASSRWMRRRCAICSSPAAAKSRSRWSRPTTRSRASSTPTSSPEAEYTQTLELDLAAVEPSVAGPKRPQDRVLLKDAAASFAQQLPTLLAPTAKPLGTRTAAAWERSMRR